MRIDRRFLGWGLFFVVLGAVPLAVRGGLVTADAAGEAWRLWPLLLVGVGVGLLLRGSRAAIVGGLVVAVTFGLIGGGMIAGGWVDLGAIACGDRTTGAAVARSGTLDLAAHVTLDQRCGDLNVKTVDGTGWTLASSGGDGAPDVTASSSDLRVESAGRRVVVFPGFGGNRETWDVGLPRGSTIDLSTTLNAGTGRLDLRGGRFGTVSTTVNAGDMRIDLEGASATRIELRLNAGDTRVVLPASSLSGSLTVNAGSIRVCAPSGVGLRFTTNNKNITSSFDFGTAGLVQSGSTWTSMNFASAELKIDLSATANAGSVALNPPDGCR